MSNGTTYKERQTLLDKIDWQMAAAVYRLLDYKWSMSDGYRHPTAAELRAHASGLLRDVEPGNGLSSGRMTARYYDGLLEMHVRALESWMHPGEPLTCDVKTEG